MTVRKSPSCLGGIFSYHRPIPPYPIPSHPTLPAWSHPHMHTTAGGERTRTLDAHTRTRTHARTHARITPPLTHSTAHATGVLREFESAGCTQAEAAQPRQRRAKHALMTFGWGGEGRWGVTLGWGGGGLSLCRRRSCVRWTSPLSSARARRDPALSTPPMSQQTKPPFRSMRV